MRDYEVLPGRFLFRRVDGGNVAKRPLVAVGRRRRRRCAFAVSAGRNSFFPSPWVGPASPHAVSQTSAPSCALLSVSALPTSARRLLPSASGSARDVATASGGKGAQPAWPRIPWRRNSISFSPIARPAPFKDVNAICVARRAERQIVIAGHSHSHHPPSPLPPPHDRVSLSPFVSSSSSPMADDDRRDARGRRVVVVASEARARVCLAC